MILSLLTDEDWKEFENDHPSANRFLLGRYLVREYLMLKREVEAGRANDWQKGRHAELEELYMDQINNGYILPKTFRTINTS